MLLKNENKMNTFEIINNYVSSLFEGKPNPT